MIFPSGCVRTPKNIKSIDEDNDVAAERQRIHFDQENSHNDVLRMVDLVKVKHTPRAINILHLSHQIDLWIDVWKDISCC